MVATAAHPDSTDGRHPEVVQIGHLLQPLRERLTVEGSEAKRSGDKIMEAETEEDTRLIEEVSRFRAGPHSCLPPPADFRPDQPGVGDS